MTFFSICNVIGSALYQRLRSLAPQRSIFAHYGQSARRAIFFARYEATQFGSGIIDTEHLLLGALRENSDRLNPLFADSSTLQGIVAEVRTPLSAGEKTTISRGLPLSPDCKRILAHSQEEADRLNHRVGVEHLLLGILREENSSASEILRRHGLQLSVLREKLAQLR
jgi:ATP-dependent Clp protease ATP-binding subunit ClpC